jgi:hypothetical protein
LCKFCPAPDNHVEIAGVTRLKTFPNTSSVLFLVFHISMAPVRVGSLSGGGVAAQGVFGGIAAEAE